MKRLFTKTMKRHHHNSMYSAISIKKQNKTGRKNFFIFALFLLIFFSASPSSFFTVSARLNMIAAPFWSVADLFFGNTFTLRSRATLVKENEVLHEQMDVLRRERQGYDVIVQENLEFRKLFAGKKEGGIFAGILAQPGYYFPFDTFLLDIGGESGIENNTFAFADQNIALGKVIETYPHSAKIKAFSSSGEVTEVFLGPEGVPVYLKGAGGGAFTAEVPHSLDVRVGDAAVLPGSEGFILAYVESKEENTDGSFQKLYLQSPVNIFELKYVQIIHKTFRGKE